MADRIIFHWDRNSDTVVMELDGQDMGAQNMQDDPAAFEAWAIILHTRLDTHPKIALSRRGQEELPPIELGAGHYNRFLYRLMKFDEAYPWFTIGDAGLSERAADFGRYLQAHRFCNNIPDLEPKEQEKETQKETQKKTQKERRAEAAFEKDQSLLGRFAEEGTIHRQFPVGLFEGSLSKDYNRVFTGGSSAIDLWGWKGDTLAVFELKTCNKMVGIITELMFYCNYMRDMYIEENEFRPKDPHLNRRKDLKKLRGYDKLWTVKETLTEVRGYMLADELHPLIDSEVLREMSASGIRYDALQYDWDPAAPVPVSNVREWAWGERPASPGF